MEQIFKVLSDFSRVRILNMLLKQKWCVTEMSTILGLSVTSVSRHLAKLRLVGMTSTEQDAQWVHNVINADFLRDNKLLFDYIQDISKRDATMIADGEKMARYKESGLTCRDICCSPNKIEDVLKRNK
jgi:ArsR family transcriptional regulator